MILLVVGFDGKAVCRLLSSESVSGSQGRWSLYHPLLGDFRVHPEQIACLLQTHTHTYTHKSDNFEP